MPRFNLLAPALISCLSLVACGAGIERLPPGAPPTPESITKERPGGNAHDPQQAALLRQVNSNFGWRVDKDQQARFPLPDRENWTRVRYFYIDHFTGFKYGDDHHALTIALVFSLKPGDTHTSQTCLDRFEKENLPKIEHFGGTLSDIHTHQTQWSNKELLVRTGTGAITVLFKHYDVAVAWTGYPAYPGTCMMYGVAIPWEDNKKLATVARDQWINEFPKFQPLTEAAPFRHK